VDDTPVRRRSKTALLKSSRYSSQRSFWATTGNASAPAAVASLSDNSREGTTTQSQSAGAVFGGQALSPPIPGDSQLFEVLGFQQGKKTENTGFHIKNYSGFF
jgi:hypothetical protein